MVTFEWDEAKRRTNIRKHGIDFVDAREIFFGPTVTTRDDRFEYGEDRFITFGMMRERVIAVAHTEHEGAIDIISARKATRREQKAYFSRVAD